MKNAQVFKSGNSQAVRLPKEYRLDVDTVRINKIGNLLVLIPPDKPWVNFIEGINEADEFPSLDNEGLMLRKVDIK
ncbi:MAG TPA: AbrB/MazE/SpoVT family DNA-binding domain-containing protein [bacterium]|nr:AbrB/MazE/SpoVT family DNA-binding domain-containing protein [bacterium]HPN45206.1 AbrB/MazE/SpoVT family DNA-binding domain-containing protein [bacterium]